MSKNVYEGITKTISFTAYTGHSCNDCGKACLGGDIDKFHEGINHCIQEHGYKLLHVGQETIATGETTVAVLGK